MRLFLYLGRLSGFAGALLCLLSILLRLGGTYWLAGFQVGTLLSAGTALMVFGCFNLLLYLTNRPQ